MITRMKRRQRTRKNIIRSMIIFSNMYLGKHLKAGMSQEEARGIMDEMLEKLLFDVPEEYHIDRDHFYEYLEKYYTEKFSAA